MFSDALLTYVRVCEENQMWCHSLPCTCFLFLLYVGSAVLVTTTTDMDKTGASYYGEQGLHYLSMRGDGNTVPLGME